MAEGDKKLIPIPGSQFTVKTNPTGVTFMGFDNENSIRISFDDMASIFGITRELVDSNDLAPTARLILQSIVNNLSDGGAKKFLSAEQGKALEDKKLNRAIQRSAIGFSFYDRPVDDPCPFNISWTDRKVYVKACRMFNYNVNRERYWDYSIPAHNTDFFYIQESWLDKGAIWYLVLDITELKLYFVVFAQLTQFLALHGGNDNISILCQGPIDTPESNFISGGVFKIDGVTYSKNINTKNLATKTDLVEKFEGKEFYDSFDWLDVWQNVSASYVIDTEGAINRPDFMHTPVNDEVRAYNILGFASVDGEPSFLLHEKITNKFYVYNPIDDEVIDFTNECTPKITNTFGTSDIGSLAYSNIGDADLCQIISYGQSWMLGFESPEAIPEDILQGVYMVGNKVAINHGNNGQNILNPLISTTATGCGENPLVSTVKSFAKLYRRFANKTQEFIATSCGMEGQSVETLSKESTNGTNYYATEFLSVLDRTKTAVDAQGKTVSCPAILYGQGENNYRGTGLGLTPGSNQTRDKDVYKAYLLQLKNNMQADIMEKYGQSERPLFFIYQTSSIYIDRLDLSINMAQLEFAQENEDVFLLNPTYQIPQYVYHPSTNGYRMYGELMAKSLYNVLIKGVRHYPIMPKNYTITGNKVQIDFYVPVKPLVFDNWTVRKKQDNGFRILKNDSDVTITDTTIDDNSVIITCNVDLVGKIEIVYAGLSRGGAGNLRDSDTWRSLYNYFDDRLTSPSKQETYTPLDKLGGSKIYEKPYPMYNWCSNFYKLINV